MAQSLFRLYKRLHFSRLRRVFCSSLPSKTLTSTSRCTLIPLPFTKPDRSMKHLPKHWKSSISRNTFSLYKRCFEKRLTCKLVAAKNGSIVSTVPRSCPNCSGVTPLSVEHVFVTSWISSIKLALAFVVAMIRSAANSRTLFNLLHTTIVATSHNKSQQTNTSSQLLNRSTHYDRLMIPRSAIYTVL